MQPIPNDILTQFAAVGQDFRDFSIGIPGIEVLRYEEFVKKG